jgi:hypothetical protein
MASRKKPELPKSKEAPVILIVLPDAISRRIHRQLVKLDQRLEDEVAPPRTGKRRRS